MSLPALLSARRTGIGLSRLLHSSSQVNAALQQKQSHSKSQPRASSEAVLTPSASYRDVRRDAVHVKSEASLQNYVKRNELGVQMLSRQLHAQIFKNVSFPAPDARYVRIAQEHLEMHGLDRTQGSVLPDVGFTLPPLQGRTIDEHFFRIGGQAAEPWLQLAKTLASAKLPPRPDFWDIQSGWTKYHYHPDGSSYSEHVDFPMHDGKPETMVVFDVETMPAYHPYPVLACAATPNGWYGWISPWLLGETTDPQQLIPLGATDVPRVVIGHNVSYDRARIQDEYSLSGTKTRFLDTMALHVAVKGISSHQRPAWMKYRKSKVKEREQKEEAFEAVVGLLHEIERRQEREQDATKQEELRKLQQAMEESLPQLLEVEGDGSVESEADISSKRWEDITSANSLADVAKLHCGIDMDKEIRNDFMTRTPEEIMGNVQDYLQYCSTDVGVTHSVYSKVLPDFLTACPSPVSFAGILTMGSSFLTVNEEWEKYLENAERTYRDLEDEVKKRLITLAMEAKDLVQDGSWKDDVWLSQLDWTPKSAGKSRGVVHEDPATESLAETIQTVTSPTTSRIPAWYQELLSLGPSKVRVVNRILPLLLKVTFDGHPMRYSSAEKWHYVVDGQVACLPTAGSAKVTSVLSAKHGLPYLKSGRMGAADLDLAMAIAGNDKSPETSARILEFAKHVVEDTQPSAINEDEWLKQLDWTPVDEAGSASNPKRAVTKTPKPPPVLWPKWFWDITRPKKDVAPGTIDITTRSRVAPLLLRLSWQGWPLFHSRQHGWTFRVSKAANYATRQTPLDFHDAADELLQGMSHQDGYVFYKLPHKDGESANVGSPLGKTFIKYAQDGTLTSPGDEAKTALDMNAQCSYWISARDRVMKQMVVWQNSARDMGFATGDASSGKKWGIIVPQVITMGTVTRRAIEKTWLTASNAKKNRVGSELKAMVRAPPGYAIVGADVDSEELWISSVMGDAQFGLHGATAIGWMTLEGTKSAGTDLHSKTASILGISRDQAKVFNYSRIYGAGMRHAVLLLLQANARMLPEEAQKLAEQLYASTKGKNTHRTDIFGRKFWFGGTESFVFNKLEEIALSDRPQTPALGCGVTYALSKEYLPAEFGSDYMPSRINWVVQSSGVDYLHLLIVAMEHLTATYGIEARYLISVHDELRYLVKEEDKYRAALALQIANLWTRSLFAYRLGMDDLPQGVAFFSAVDIDHVLRKETDMPCVTPSQAVPIAPGECLDIQTVLAKTKGGSLWADGHALQEDIFVEPLESPEGYVEPNCLQHRANDAAFLRAQATTEFAEVKHLAQQASGLKYEGGIGGGKNKKRGRKPKISQLREVDEAALEQIMQNKQHLGNYLYAR
ncbi:gamma DNA-directed DNA polymerase [Dentipellis sp. KUC8613]|nr:gamma DNA-directed DNA polymerase [Dentipellis sp. KUC8613]